MNLEKSVLFGSLSTITLCVVTLIIYFAGGFTLESLETKVNPGTVVVAVENENSEPLEMVSNKMVESKVSELSQADENVVMKDVNQLEEVLKLDALLASFESDEALNLLDPPTAEERATPPLLSAGTTEKYYVAEGERCSVIRYTCDKGWDFFSDDIGCGCEKLVEPVITETPKLKAENYPLIESEWGENLNPEAVVPTNIWQAFYFSTTEPKEVVKTETVDRLSVNFNWSDMEIEPEEFAAYWVGDWEFAEETLWAINVAQGWSKARIIIDDRLVYDGNTSAEVLYTFTPGTHRIEVEYLNAWHTVEFSVNFGEPVERLSKDRILTWIKRNRLQALPLGVVSVYESNSFDTRIPITFADENEPILLLLSSYSGVEWNLNSMPEWVRGVVVASYESGTRAVGVPESVPLVYLKDYLDLPYRLQPECGSFGGYAHCEHTGLVGIDAVIEPIFETTPKYFSGAYNTPGLTMPDLSISDDLRKNITTSYEAWKDQQRSEKEKKADFEGLFD